jgi:Mn-containing catalase
MRIVSIRLFKPKLKVMFHHSKDLQFNARVSRPDPAFANILLEQFGGENGELAATAASG